MPLEAIWLGRVNAYLGQHGLFADLWIHVIQPGRTTSSGTGTGTAMLVFHRRQSFRQHPGSAQYTPYGRNVGQTGTVTRLV